MPKKFEKKLRKEAAKKHLSAKRAAAYVYGTMRKLGWVPKKERTGEQKEKDEVLPRKGWR